MKKMEAALKKVSIHNLGCKVNSYEAESMEQMLKEAGYEIIPFSEENVADVYIINTCSVTNIADRKSRQMLHKAKKMNPDAIVVAAGCYVQADSEACLKDSAVDIVLGNNMKINIVEALNNYYKDKKDDAFVIDINKDSDYEELNINTVNEHSRAYIKIQDGCNQFCSYCIIPYVRGRIRSRDMKEIYAEVERLVAKGYKEIVLTGIHLTSYGMDNNKGSLLEVIKMLHDIEGLERIRLGSLEPRVVTDDFAREISKLNKVCPHFHLSLQSGCDKTLKAMNRKYSTKEYYECCVRLRKCYDNPAITTDVIVGFPGESEEDFAQTKKFLEKVGFYEMHIFKYSRRKGTVADKMPDQIDEKVKTLRSNELLELEKNMSYNYRKSYLGKNATVLLEEEIEHDGQKFYAGYTSNYLRVILEKDEVDALTKDAVNTVLNIKLLSVEDDGILLRAAII